MTLSLSILAEPPVAIELNLLQIDQHFGGWKEAQTKHFVDGGVFDEIYAPGS